MLDGREPCPGDVGAGIAASDQQVGGTHYRDMEIQPSEYIYRNGLNWLEGNAVKYITRHHFKGGEQDIDKAIHYLNLLKEWHYANEIEVRGSDSS